MTGLTSLRCHCVQKVLSLVAEEPCRRKIAPKCGVASPCLPSGNTGQTRVDDIAFSANCVDQSVARCAGAVMLPWFLAVRISPTRPALRTLDAP